MEITHLVNTLGVSLPALKLVITVFIGVFISFFHRLLIQKVSKTAQQLSFVAIGLTLLYWNYGIDCLHSLICVVLQWMFFHILGSTLLCAVISFMFNMSYLLVGYYMTMTDGYDILWTMPHCILCLRLIGLAFDVYDGHKDPKSRTAEQSQYAIADTPSLLEMLGFSYFYASFLVGPQTSLLRYREMLAGKLTDVPGKPPNSVMPALTRLFCGIFILGFHNVLKLYFQHVSSFSADERKEMGILLLSLRVLADAYVFFTQYVGIWMINESSCIMCGLGCNVKDGKVSWDALRNVRCGKFLLARSYQDMIESFNINTNNWVARYVFKRLRFLGNKRISHISTLLFLAIWHGYHEGYFVTFVYEFIVMNAERPARDLLNSFTFIKAWKTSSFSWLFHVCAWLYVKLGFGYCVIAFTALKWNSFIVTYNLLYWYGHIFYLSLWVGVMVYNNVQAKKHVKTN